MLGKAKFVCNDQNDRTGMLVKAKLGSLFITGVKYSSTHVLEKKSC